MPGDNKGMKIPRSHTSMLILMVKSYNCARTVKEFLWRNAFKYLKLSNCKNQKPHRDYLLWSDSHSNTVGSDNLEVNVKDLYSECLLFKYSYKKRVLACIFSVKFTIEWNQRATLTLLIKIRLPGNERFPILHFMLHLALFLSLGPSCIRGRITLSNG